MKKVVTFQTSLQRIIVHFYCIIIRDPGYCISLPVNVS